MKQRQRRERIVHAETSAVKAKREITSPKPGFRPLLIAGLVYAFLVLIMWGAYNPHSGMPYETVFPYMSETESAWRGFSYLADPLRIYTNTFYHLSYLLSEAFAIPGSYVPYQVVYALLWWARGFLVFAILRRFFPSAIPLCYAAGALTLVHASDRALQWVGQMNQFGFIFWMLLAMYCMTEAWYSRRAIAIAVLALAACFCEQMALWSYESELLIVLVFPLFLLLTGRGRRRWPLAVIWYGYPGLYIAKTISKYLQSAGQSYQETVMRKSWAAGSVVSDWVFNVGASLGFWKWPAGAWKYSTTTAYVVGGIAAAAFGAGLVALAQSNGKDEAGQPFPASAKTCWTVAGAGALVLVLSFPVYLALNSARGLWRTQMLSGVGAGILMAAILGIVASFCARRTLQLPVMIAMGAAVTWFGAASAVQEGGFHRWIWERHRTAMLEVLHVAPQVRPETIVIMTNVPKNSDPFGDQLWFDYALRLAYPHIPVSGIYFYMDGTAGPGNNFRFEHDFWRWDGAGFGRLVGGADLDHTLVVDYSASGQGKLAAALPDFVCRAQCSQERYHPGAAVASRAVSPIAARRFRVGE